MSLIPKNKNILFALLFLVGFLFFASPSDVFAANRYWVGGGSSANWNATGPTNWGSASNTQDNVSVPGVDDDVFFDGVGTGASNSTLSANITINSLDMTGYANTLTHNAAVNLTVDGNGVNFILAAGMTYTLGDNSTSTLVFTGTSGNTLITTAGKTVGNITLNGVGGTRTLQDALTSSALIFSDGTLDTNGQTVSIERLTANDSNTKTLTFGASSITVTGNTGWNMGSNTTVNAGTSTITLTSTSPNFTGGGKTYNNVVFTGSTTASILDGGNTFANLTRTGTAVKTSVFSLAGNQTVTGTLRLDGNSATNRLLVFSSSIGTARTITAGTMSASTANVDFKDITGAGAANWNLSAITGGSGDAGGNSGITFTPAATQYFQTGAGTSWSWSDSRWFLATNGGGGAGRVPLPQDDVVFDANSITATGKTITQDMPRAGKNINWTGVTNAPTLNTNTAASIFGSLTLASGMTLLTNSQTYIFEGRGSHTLTNAGKSWGSKPIVFNTIVGTYTLQDDLTSTANLTISSGTFNANNFNVSVDAINTSNSTTRTITMGSGTWTLANTSGTVWNASTSGNLPLNANTSTIKYTASTTNALTFAGGGKTYNNFWFSNATPSGSLTISGSNTFNDFRVETAPQTVLFTTGTTQTVNTFTVSGTAGNLITINSTTTGTHALTKSGGGTVCSDYLNIQHSVASPGSTWFAGANSTNNQAVATAGSGWSFTACDSTAPVFSSVTPTDSSFINSVTTSSDISYSVDEALASGSITITRTGGAADGASPHTCTLIGTALASGAHTINLSDTTNGCTSDVSNLVSGTIYTFVFAGQDAAANVATPITRTNVTFDNVLPTITNVTSDKANGTYSVGEVIDIDVTFSETVTSTGNVTVTLETGAIDRTCTFTVSSATTGTCDYTVQSGDTSSDLTVSSIAGSIADATGNAMTNFVPATNLAANKALVIDTTSPTVSTQAASDITETSATLNGSIDAIGGSNPTSRGFDWGTTISYGTTITENGSFSTGAFTSDLSSLSCATLYHYRAYATNTAGTSTGSDQSFTTLDCPSQSSGSSGGNTRMLGVRKSTPTVEPEVTPPENNTWIDAIIPDFFSPKKEEEPAPIPVKVVEKEAEPALQGEWNLLSSVTQNFVLAPLPDEILDLNQKFPELAQVFKDLGINTVGDLDKLQNASINLPVIGKAEQIPEEVMIAKGSDINIGSQIVLNENGEIEQKINIVSGSPVTLSLKPSGEVESLKGYLLFKQKPTQALMEVPMYSLLGNVLHSTETSKDVPTELVVLAFEYTDPDKDGIFTATLDAPLVEGEYEVLTIINYQDPKKGSKAIRMITVVDPEGYVYETNEDGREIRLEGVEVAIFLSDGILWNGEEYRQTNPQRTDKTGDYSFLVPPGSYYLTAEKAGYHSYQSDEFKVTEGPGVHFNVELEKDASLTDAFRDWKAWVIIVLSGAVIINFINDRILRKKLLIQNK